MPERIVKPVMKQFGKKGGVSVEYHTADPRFGKQPKKQIKAGRSAHKSKY